MPAARWQANDLPVQPDICDHDHEDECPSQAKINLKPMQ